MIDARFAPMRPTGGGCRTPARGAVLVYAGFPGFGQGKDEKLLKLGESTSVFEFQGGGSPEAKGGVLSRVAGVAKGVEVVYVGRG